MLELVDSEVAAVNASGDQSPMVFAVSEPLVVFGVTNLNPSDAWGRLPGAEIAVTDGDVEV